MSVGKKIAHKAESAKGTVKSSSVAPSATPACVLKDAPISSRATPNRPAPRSKTPSNTDLSNTVPGHTYPETRQPP